MEKRLFESTEIPPDDLLDDMRKLLKADASTREMAERLLELGSEIDSTDKAYDEKAKDLLRDWKGDKELLGKTLKATRYLLCLASNRGVPAREAIQQIGEFIRPDLVPEEVSSYFEKVARLSERIWLKNREEIALSMANPTWSSISYALSIRPVFGSDFDAKLGDSQQYFNVYKWIPVVAIEIETRLAGKNEAFCFSASLENVEELHEIIGRLLKRMKSVRGATELLNTEKVTKHA